MSIEVSSLKADIKAVISTLKATSSTLSNQMASLQATVAVGGSIGLLLICLRTIAEVQATYSPINSLREDLDRLATLTRHIGD